MTAVLWWAVPAAFVIGYLAGCFLSRRAQRVIAAIALSPLALVLLYTLLWS
ncbi:hypothetical protein [Kitasatospora sp. NPDC057738]|uniref:hypothetical protein n=1 Tax=Kitasatospora sp. NPDC057738 TaxID=3346233 RepID=UPI0036A8D05E